MTQRKIALVIGYGQSNERGTGVAARISGTAILPSDTANNVRHMGVFGQSNNSLTLTSNYVDPCSMFQKLGEHLSLETGLVVKVVNTTVGGRGVTDDWCGWDTTNSRVKVQGDSGYDPNSYISTFVTAVAAAVTQGYEVWTITAGHQQDLTYARPVNQIIAGSVYVQQRALAAGAAKVFVGRTPRFIGGSNEAEWNPGGKIHQIADGVLAGIPGAFAGADLSVNTDTRLCANDSSPYIHLNHAGVCWAAEQWLLAIKASGAI